VLLVADYAEISSGPGELLRAVLDDPGPGLMLLAGLSGVVGVGPGGRPVVGHSDPGLSRFPS